MFLLHKKVSSLEYLPFQALFDQTVQTSLLQIWHKPFLFPSECVGVFYEFSPICPLRPLRLQESEQCTQCSVL